MRLEFNDKTFCIGLSIEYFYFLYLHMKSFFETDVNM